MLEIIEPQTDRLKLRQWRDSDRQPFAEINSDPRVMEFYPNVLTRHDSDAMIDRTRGLIEQQGWGFWAVERKNDNRFIGFVGLNIPSDALPFSPCVEIGWRLAYEHWGKGYATEAARAALITGFEDLGLAEIVSFTSVRNNRSRAVMQRLGMKNTGKNFPHPNVFPDSRLQEHCLYSISSSQWHKICSFK